MGVVCVLNYPVPEGSSGAQAVDVLHQRLEDLGAVRSGNFSVDCETFQSTQAMITSQSQLVHVMHNSEYPVTCFSILNNGRCLVADILFNVLMLKMKDFYMSRKNSRVECKGQRYEMGDFVIKVGSIVLGQNASFKGILIEVEYTACLVAEDCWRLLQEFMQAFMGPSLEPETNHFKAQMKNIFTPKDAVLQYLEHFNNCRRTS